MTKRLYWGIWLVYMLMGSPFAHASVSGVRWYDLFWPREDGYYAQWNLRARGGYLQVFGSGDDFAPSAVPMLMEPEFVFYDSIKRVRLVPFLASFDLQENGRNGVFESFSYGINIGTAEFDVLLHPQIHFSYGGGLYHSGLEHHVAGAGLSMYAGVRIPLWYRSTIPVEYERAHVHIRFIPLRLIMLGRYNVPDMSGDDQIHPVANGDIGLEWAIPLPSDFSWTGRLGFYYSYSRWQTLFQNDPITGPASIAKGRTAISYTFAEGAMTLQVGGFMQLPITPVSRNLNVYGLYFDRYLSLGLEAGLTFHIFTIEQIVKEFVDTSSGALVRDSSLWVRTFRDKRYKLKGEPMYSSKVRNKKFFHYIRLQMTAIKEHTAVDDGVYPELRYRLQHSWWLDVELGVRFGPPDNGDLLRYFVKASGHIPIPGTRDVALQFGWTHSSFTDIQKGDNVLTVTTHLESKHFEFTGGLAVRFLLSTPEQFQNPFTVDSQYVETTLLYDFRWRLEFMLGKQKEHLLQVGIGVTDFMDSDILTSNTSGYILFVRWKNEKMGEVELVAGTMSYSLLDLAGFHGRQFIRLYYTYTFAS